MTDSILIFTFSPVQSFISEARRTADLYVGSRILVELATAAGRAIVENGGGGREDRPLIYPAVLEAQDVPNKLVARVPWERAEEIAAKARQALLDKWKEIAATACDWLKEKGPPPDQTWSEIWERQIGRHWEVYWSVALWDGDYVPAYRLASRGLDAAKRTRAFDPSEEGDRKDSLSGRRTALRLGGTKQDARWYWGQIAGQVEPARLRPEGKERLDAIGAVKRFCELARKKGFASTSSVAAADYVAMLDRAPQEVMAHQRAVEDLLGNCLHPLNTSASWPYDGNLLYEETFTRARLREDYNLQTPDQHLLDRAKATLRNLFTATERQPSPYYAIIVLDGDNMGAQVAACESAEQHRELSEKLSRFARTVGNGLGRQGEGSWGYHAQLVYNGGDDVLVLSPLAEALDLAQRLAGEFEQTVGATASAGIAIAHHLYPLDAALRAARRAEKQAKGVEGKAALCVHVLKRSGQTREMRSRWQDMGDNMARLVELFRDDSDGGAQLAAGLAYDLLAVAPALPEADDKLAAELRRLLRRHRNRRHPQPLSETQCQLWACQLRAWAASMPGAEPEFSAQQGEMGNQTEELGHWLTLAHWIAQGGREQ